MRTSYKLDGISVACGSIDPLPGSSQVAVFHSAFVLPQHRNTKVGTQAHLQRLTAAREALYDFALVTVDITNEAQIKILKNCGWTPLDVFRSRKTGHLVEIWGKPL